MKLLLGLLVSLAISSAFALPARSPKDEVDIVEVPRGPQRSRENDADAIDDDTDVDFRDFKGVVDTGAGYPFLAPLPHPFSFNLGFFDSFEDIFRRLRTRLWSTDSGESSEEGGFSLGLDPSKGANTTSVVKVVDGHKIEINDTVIGNRDGANGAVFKFRVINIRPVSDEDDIESATIKAVEGDTETRDIEGKSEEATESGEDVKPDANEINANIDDPESTTEAITTEMHDTIPHRLPSSDNNAIDNDSPVDRDELQVDDLDAAAVLGTLPDDQAESFHGAEDEDDDDDVATLDEDNAVPVVGNTIKSEKLSGLVNAENINDASEDIEQSTEPNEDNDKGNDREFNESIDVNKNAEEIEAFDEILQERQQFEEALVHDRQQMQELVDSVGEKFSMADEEEERFADKVEKMLSASIDGSSSSSNNQRGHHSLREDLSSSDDDEDDEDVNDVNNRGLNSEWGSLHDKNVLTNEIDVYENVPIDLSNDIAINDIMADQGAPTDPDAEIFNVEEFTPNNVSEFMTGRRFEVLRDIK